jgi:archaellum component FlaC
MRKSVSAFFVMMTAIALNVIPADANAQGGKLFCWKNKAGKTECGDKIPYEYQDAAIKEMNRQGVVTSRSESLSPEERKAREAADEKRVAEKQRQDEQRRKDKALLDTFSNDKEIDLKRRRDIQLVESIIETLQSNLKNIDARKADAEARADRFVKEKKPVPPPIQDELERVKTDNDRTTQQIAQKRKEIIALNQRYDDLKKRYIELTGTTASAPQKKASTK